MGNLYHIAGVMKAYWIIRRQTNSWPVKSRTCQLVN